MIYLYFEGDSYVEMHTNRTIDNIIKKIRLYVQKINLMCNM